MGGTLDSNAYRVPNSSFSTGTLSGTTTFTLFANGNGTSTNRTVTVYVSGGPYTYAYQCSDGIDNDGNGLADYSSDPGCSSPYDNDESGAYGSSSISVISTIATNVSSSTARLNGIVQNAQAGFAAYFEYGTTPSLGQSSVFQNLAPVTSINVYDTIAVQPNTTYYYRAATEIGTTIVRGSIVSFKTPAAGAIPVSYIGGNTSNQGTDSASGSTAGQSSTPAKPSAVTVTVTNKSDKVLIGDTVENTITYANGTGKTLGSAVLTIILPEGFAIKQSTQGTVLNPTTISVQLGSIAPGASGSIFVEDTVGPNTPRNETLVTNATLAYILPSGVRDSAVGYVINHASAENVLAGFALGSGFFPSTIFGWLITVIIILTIILIARRISKAKRAEHAHAGHGGHGADGKAADHH